MVEVSIFTTEGDLDLQEILKLTPLPKTEQGRRWL
jgi:hypothetical protein